VREIASIRVHSPRRAPRREESEEALDFRHQERRRHERGCALS
jgi:hypothetical protein